MRQELKNVIGGCLIEDGPMVDNVAIVLCTYFSDHTDRPENDPEDGESNWGVWVLDKYEKAMELIVDEIADHVKTQKEYIDKLECDIKKKDATTKSLLPVTMSLCPKCEKYGISGREIVCMRCIIISLIQKNKELEAQNKEMKQTLPRSA